MKRTKLLCLRNIRFFKDGHLLSTPSANLEFADSVAVTFEMQENEQKHETIIHGQTDDPFLCPVKQWALLINRIWSYQGTTENTPVCTVWHHDRREQITSRQVVTSLRAACATIGSARLGFEPRNWHTFSSIRCRNGDVSCRRTSLHHHANQQMAERRLFAIYSQAGRTILERRCTKNANPAFSLFN